ncbi:unnamed protein product [Symbiodinium natans]|uniref:Uncharacterized protein n=1 Tax=Symbiodinium natans TaxID=878477 RepID=A0A812L0L6_9DINO|nr:unnamed protein product [Symbiodinium natans]
MVDLQGQFAQLQDQFVQAAQRWSSSVLAQNHRVEDLQRQLHHLADEGEVAVHNDVEVEQHGDVPLASTDQFQQTVEDAARHGSHSDACFDMQRLRARHQEERMRVKQQRRAARLCRLENEKDSHEGLQLQ